MSSRNQGRLERRINDELDRIGRELAKKPGSVEEYYWSSAKIRNFGVSTTPAPGASVPAQLLVTPRLIVDIHPLSPGKFAAYYGVDAAQLTKLAYMGFVVPNFYHYKSEGWQDYLEYPPLVDLLAEFGRVNSEWITRYLSEVTDYRNAERRCSTFFREVRVSESDRESVLNATHRAVTHWDRFPEVYGQRLAYIEVLGGEKLKPVVSAIKDWYRDPGRRIDAVKVLCAAKALIATEVTAAYGGVVTDSEQTLSDVRQAIDTLEDLLGKRPRLTARRVRRSEIHFAEELIAKTKRVKLHRFGESPPRRKVALTSAEFKKFIKVLGKVKDGRLGELMDAMSMSLDPTNQADLSLDEYREVARELDEDLRWLAPVAVGLDRIGNSLMILDESSPRTDDFWWTLLGPNVKVFAARLHGHEMTPLVRRRHPRRLYVRWRSVKRALDLNAM